MFIINERIRIEDDELEWSFVRAGGPGGQNVNKVSSKAVMRWNALKSPTLPADVRERLFAQQKSRVTGGGELIITSQRFRDQEKNRQDCLDKLRVCLERAMHVPKARRVTKPTRSSKARRVAEKRHRSAGRAARRVADE